MNSCNGGNNGLNHPNLTPEEMCGLMPSVDVNKGIDLSNLTLQEVRDLLPAIDEKAFEYIKKLSTIETEDPILVLDYMNVRDPNQQNQFLWIWDDQAKQQVATALTAQGVGGRRVSANATCFKFDTPEEMLQAKQLVKYTIPWAFNISAAGAHLINAMWQQVNPGQASMPIVPSPPKIRTDVINFYTEESGRQKIDRDTKFFED